MMSSKQIAALAMFAIGACGQTQDAPSEVMRSYTEEQPRLLRGRVGTRRLTGPITGAVINYVVYLPEGYETGSQRFPTIYHLHGGLQGSWDNERPIITLETNRIAAALEEAVESELTDAAIIVAPHDPFGLSMWSDSKDGAQPAETMFIQELIPHIDTEYRTPAVRSGRVVQGFSMGGFGAATSAVKYPELFSISIN